MSAIEVKKYVAVFIDGGFSSGVCKSECTQTELENLKLDHDKNCVSLIGWLPISLYNGYDVDIYGDYFINYD